MHQPYEITDCVNHSQQAFPWELYNTRDYYCISAVSVHVIEFYSVRDLRLVTGTSHDLHGNQFGPNHMIPFMATVDDVQG